MAHTHTHGHGHNANVEQDVIDMGAIVKFIVYLTITTVVVHFFVLWLMRTLSAQADAAAVINYPLAQEQGERLPPLPRLQTTPREDLKKLREGWTLSLEHYAWIDKNAGVVRLPIEEAKKRVLAQGLPTRSATSSPAAAATPQNAEPR